jgi:ribosomal protein L37E
MSNQITMEQTPLNSLDRCDRCGAQAYVRAILISGGQLLFCAHHGKTYAQRLRSVEATIQDESEKLAK